VVLRMRIRQPSQANMFWTRTPMGTHPANSATIVVSSAVRSARARVTLTGHSASSLAPDA